MSDRRAIGRLSEEFVLLVTSVQPSTLRISRGTSIEPDAAEHVEQNNTHTILAILSILSDTSILLRNTADSLAARGEVLYCAQSA